VFDRGVLADRWMDWLTGTFQSSARLTDFE
jgi:hypothetical protein